MRNASEAGARHINCHVPQCWNYYAEISIAPLLALSCEAVRHVSGSFEQLRTQRAQLHLNLIDDVRMLLVCPTMQ